jgi:hypothetical protein
MLLPVPVAGVCLTLALPGALLLIVPAVVLSLLQVLLQLLSQRLVPVLALAYMLVLGTVPAG